MAQTYHIKTPDGQEFDVDAPDDYTPEQVNGLVRQHLGGKFANNPFQNNPAPAQPKPQADPEDSLIADVGSGVAEIGRGFGEGAAGVLDNAADWAQSGLNAAGNAIGAGSIGDQLNSLWGSGQNNLAASIAPPQPGMDTLRGIGRFGGEVAGTLPLAALPGGVLTQGAAGGALLSKENTAVGVGEDAAIGALGAKVGSSLFGGAAALANPQPSEAVSTLARAGVRVSPGQYARSGEGFANKLISATEDRATSLPLVGDKIVSDRVRTNQQFNAAAINRALEPIGESLPAGLQAGRRAIRHAGDRLSAAYDDVLPRLSAVGDQQFVDDLAGIHSEASTMAPDRVAQFNNILSGLGRFFRDGTTLDGDSFKAIETRIGDKARRFARSQDADQQELGNALENVLGSVRELAARQNPAEAERLRAINQGWKSLTQVERAGLTAKGEFGPAGYSQAVRRSSDTARSRGYARGTALNQDLSDAASDVLPSDIPDSGTAGRWALANLPALGLGALASVPYGGASLATRALTRQGATSPALEQLLRLGARGAPVAAPALIDQSR